jgi:hypothetical protein
MAESFFPFLSLPYDIRLDIYKELLTLLKDILCCMTYASSTPSIPTEQQSTEALEPTGFGASVLGICKQIYQEALPQLYGQNKFDFPLISNCNRFFQEISSEASREIRHVQILVDVGFKLPYTARQENDLVEFLHSMIRPPVNKGLRPGGLISCCFIAEVVVLAGAWYDHLKLSEVQGSEKTDTEALDESDEELDPEDLDGSLGGLRVPKGRRSNERAKRMFHNAARRCAGRFRGRLGLESVEIKWFEDKGGMLTDRRMLPLDQAMTAT